MTADPLAPLLAFFNARARTFFTGNLCTRVDFPDDGGTGFLHLLRSGRAALHERSGSVLEMGSPMLVFYTRPLTHWFDPEPRTGADLACATVTFEHQAFNPIARALPPRFHCELAELGGMAPLLNLLFDEAFADRPGRQSVLDRLFEVVLIELLRVTIARGGTTDRSFLCALAHPQLHNTLTAIHAEPARTWTLESMARTASMSRSRFAAEFKAQLGETPGEYLTRWRVSVAQAMIRSGVPLKLIPERIGYASQAGFLRAFKLVVGVPPRTWAAQQEAPAPR